MPNHIFQLREIQFICRQLYFSALQQFQIIWMPWIFYNVIRNQNPVIDVDTYQTSVKALCKLGKVHLPSRHKSIK